MRCAANCGMRSFGSLATLQKNAMLIIVKNYFVQDAVGALKYKLGVVKCNNARFDAVKRDNIDVIYVFRLPSVTS